MWALPTSKTIMAVESDFRSCLMWLGTVTNHRGCHFQVSSESGLRCKSYEVDVPNLDTFLFTPTSRKM